MTERTAPKDRPLWSGTVSVLAKGGSYYGAAQGVAVRASAVHIAARLAVAMVRARLPARTRVKGIVLRLERQETAK